MDRNDLIACFYDTLEFSNSEKIRDLTEKAIKSNCVYQEGFISEVKHRNENAFIEVYSDTTCIIQMYI